MKLTIEQIEIARFELKTSDPAQRRGVDELCDLARIGAAVMPQKQVCDEILDIMKTYDEQEAEGYVDTPGGLEHMGDVWRLLDRWRCTLSALPKPTP